MDTHHPDAPASLRQAASTARDVLRARMMISLMEDHADVMASSVAARFLAEAERDEDGTRALVVDLLAELAGEAIARFTQPGDASDQALAEAWEVFEAWVEGDTQEAAR